MVKGVKSASGSLKHEIQKAILQYKMHVQYWKNLTWKKGKVRRVSFLLISGSMIHMYRAWLRVHLIFLQHELQKAILQRRLGRNIDTDNHEMIIAADVVDPSDIDIGMDDIGGLEDTKKTLVSSSPAFPNSLRSNPPHSLLPIVSHPNPSQPLQKCSCY